MKAHLVTRGKAIRSSSSRGPHWPSARHPTSHASQQGLGRTSDHHRGGTRPCGHDGGGAFDRAPCRGQEGLRSLLSPLFLGADSLCDRWGSRCPRSSQTILAGACARYGIPLPAGKAEYRSWRSVIELQPTAHPARSDGPARGGKTRREARMRPCQVGCGPRLTRSVRWECARSSPKWRILHPEAV
jgi:hypothetical protein